MPSWPRAYGRPGCSGLLKVQPADFVVDELPLVDPCGCGDHLYVHVEKTGLTSVEVAGRLARAAAVPPQDVSYAGMKDKHAVARQWFSVREPRGPIEAAADDDLRILFSARHTKKLRRGQLRGNRFTVRLTGFTGDPAAALTRFELLVSDGFPNYFGPQRFGSDNLPAAMAWIAQFRRRRISRFRRGLYLSVLRALLFNEVLAARVNAATWCCRIDGDVLDDMAPTGPLWGRGRSAANAAALQVEQAALEPYAELCHSLEHTGLRQDRRPLAACPARPHAAFEKVDTLALSFDLPPGVYALSLLAELADLRTGVERARAV